MCDTSKYNKEPTETNHRRACSEVMERAADTKPWFGMEQVRVIVVTLMMSSGHSPGH